MATKKATAKKEALPRVTGKQGMKETTANDPTKPGIPSQLRKPPVAGLPAKPRKFIRPEDAEALAKGTLKARPRAPLPSPAVKRKANERGKQGREVVSDTPRASFFDTYLKARGIDPKFARDHGVHSATPTEMKRDGYLPALPAIVFNNIDPVNGRRQASPARLEEPQGDKKFIYAKGSDAEPYRVDFGQPWKEIENDVKVPIVISEGATRVLAGAQRGIAVIGGNGVDGIFEPGTKRGKLRAVFDRIKWKSGRRRRPVYISYDADAATKADVKDASNKAAGLLDARGAGVCIVPAMRVTADGKSGIDDEFAACGHTGYLARCAAAPPWAITEHTGIEPEVRVLHDIAEETIEYIWPGRIARGSLTMFSGDPGTAKSFLAITLAADFSKPLGKERPKGLRTLYATTENSPGHVIKPRFRAAGGDDRYLLILDGAKDESGILSAITLGDLAPLEKAVNKYKIDLLVLDPLQSYIGADVDFHKANETRPRMDALARLAANYNIGVVIIRHLAKASGGRSIHRGLGSIDFTGAVRIELMVGHVADQPNNRAIIPIKNNFGILVDGLDFSIEGKDMDAKLVWKGASTKTLADLQGVEKSTTGIDRAYEFLQKQLSTGPKTRAELLEASGGEFKIKMLERARKLMGLVDSRRDGARGPVTWSLRSKPLVN